MISKFGFNYIKDLHWLQANDGVTWLEKVTEIQNYLSFLSGFLKKSCIKATELAPVQNLLLCIVEKKGKFSRSCM